MVSKHNVLVSVVGPTAVGKTSFAIRLAKAFDAEIISADSRQFYREMELGTAKPDESELKAVKHHLVNSHSIENYYSAGRFEQDALHILEKIFSKNRVAIAVGGSGLYLKALWEGMDDMPEVQEGVREQLNEEFRIGGLDPLLDELENRDPDYYREVDRKNHQRVIRALEVIRSTKVPFSKFRRGRKQVDRPFGIVKIGLDMERKRLYDRINFRMDQMIENGLFDEARKLYPYRNLNALQTVGYSEIFGYLDGAYDYDEAVRLLKRNSRRYAKRQLTWFKKDPEIHWMHPEDHESAIGMIRKELEE